MILKMKKTVKSQKVGEFAPDFAAKIPTRGEN